MSTYRIKEFAALTGVSVRALHHYGRLGLLKPHRARTGYRLYTADHVAIVEQIVALRFVGTPLMSIGKLLRSDPREWDQVLDAQRRVLEEKDGDWTSRSKRFVKLRERRAGNSIA